MRGLFSTGLLTAFALAAATTAAAQGASLDVPAAVAHYLDSLSPEAKARSDAYFEGGYWLMLWGLLYGLAVAWILLDFRISSRLRDAVERQTRRAFLRTFLYAGGYVLLAALLGFPLTLYTDFFREHAYGLATQDFMSWLGDFLRGRGFAVVGFGIAAAVLYAVIRRTPRHWHLWGTGAMTALLAVALFVSPVLIEPAFNDYTPMEDGPLKEEILSMARANGVPAADVFVVDASRQTTRISANVAGLFGTMRIALNDNLLEQGTPAEIQAVMGHELGHYVLGHSLDFMLSFGLLIALGFTFVHWGFGRIHARYGARWGIRDIADPAGLPLLMALLSVFFFLATPLTNSIVRSGEADADIFGLNAARAPDGFASIAMKLAAYRKIAPGRFEEAIFFDHPSGKSRVEMAMRWKAEHVEAEDISSPPARP